MHRLFLVLWLVESFGLTSTRAFIDCRTACHKCKKGFDEVSVLEVYCSMCKECRDRRRERLAQKTATAAVTTISPENVYKQIIDHNIRHLIARGRTRPNVRHSYLEQQMETWPDNCPTPPICSEEEIVVAPTTTTTTTTSTTTAPPPTCPPIVTCRPRPKTTHRPPECCTPACVMPCMPCNNLPSKIDVNINWNGNCGGGSSPHIIPDEIPTSRPPPPPPPTTDDDWLEETTVLTTADPKSQVEWISPANIIQQTECNPHQNLNGQFLVNGLLNLVGFSAPNNVPCVTSQTRAPNYVPQTTPCVTVQTTTPCVTFPTLPPCVHVQNMVPCDPNLSVQNIPGNNVPGGYITNSYGSGHKVPGNYLPGGNVPAGNLPGANDVQDDYLYLYVGVPKSLGVRKLDPAPPPLRRTPGLINYYE